MNVGLWIGFGGLFVTALTLGWQMLRDRRVDRDAQQRALLEREERRTRYETRVDSFGVQLADHETRMRRLEGRPDED